MYAVVFATISNATINARLRHGNLAHVGDGCRQQLCIQNCCETAADRDVGLVTINSL